MWFQQSMFWYVVTRGLRETKKAKWAQQPRVSYIILKPQTTIVIIAIGRTLTFWAHSTHANQPTMWTRSCATHILHCPAYKSMRCFLIEYVTVTTLPWHPEIDVTKFHVRFFFGKYSRYCLWSTVVTQSPVCGRLSLHSLLFAADYCDRVSCLWPTTVTQSPVCDRLLSAVTVSCLWPTVVTLSPVCGRLLWHSLLFVTDCCDRVSCLWPTAVTLCPVCDRLLWHSVLFVTDCCDRVSCLWPTVVTQSPVCGRIL